MATPKIKRVYLEKIADREFITAYIILFIISMLIVVWWWWTFMPH